MHILIVNDDGYLGKGLHALILALKETYTLTVVVPKREMSGTSNHITYQSPILVEKRHLNCIDFDVYIADGTPADCCMLGISQLCNSRPDLVISGINKGHNVARGLYYSGTIAAGLHGVFEGIPAIAMSSEADGDYSGAACFLKKALPELYQKDQLFYYNINFPDGFVSDAKGLKKTRPAANRFSEYFDRRPGPLNTEFFWHLYMDSLDYSQENPENIPDFYLGELEEDTDLYALKQGYISLSPLHVQYFDSNAWNILPDLDKVFQQTMAI